VTENSVINCTHVLSDIPNRLNCLPHSVCPGNRGRGVRNLDEREVQLYLYMIFSNHTPCCYSGGFWEEHCQ